MPLVGGPDGSATPKWRTSKKGTPTEAKKILFQSTRKNASTSWKKIVATLNAVLVFSLKVFLSFEMKYCQLLINYGKKATTYQINSIIG